MEGDVENNELLSDEEREPELYVIRVVKCTARQEWEWEDYFEAYPVAVNDYVYQRGVWRDPVARTSKRRVHSRWRVEIDEGKVRLEERRRMEMNEVTEFYFLIHRGGQEG